MFAYRSILHEQARPAVVRESRLAPWLAVSVVCFGAFMGQLDASIVTITFPAMERDFSVPVAAVQWVSLIYPLGLIAMLAPAGRLGDAVGRKLVYIYGFAVFTVASAACGLAPSLGALVALRLIQAIGAAMLQANSVALVTTSAPKVRMRFALGVLGHTSTARAGLLLSALPLGFGLAALLGDLLLPKAWGDRRRGFAGALLACAVMCAATVVPVTQATVAGQLALAGLGLGIFVPANNTVIMRSTSDSSASLVGGLVSMARGIGTTFGISLMALALHLGTQSSQAGNHGYATQPGYPGAEQARPAFIVLAVAAATAAAIALAAGRTREADPPGADR
jgi:MFS family permease